MRFAGSVRAMALLLVLALLPVSVLAQQGSVTLGVLGYRSGPLVLQKYQPLADYLSKESGMAVTIRVLSQEDMDRADTFAAPAGLNGIRAHRGLRCPAAPAPKPAAKPAPTAVPWHGLSRQTASRAASLRPPRQKLLAGNPFVFRVLVHQSFPFQKPGQAPGGC